MSKNSEFFFSKIFPVVLRMCCGCVADCVAVASILCIGCEPVVLRLCCGCVPDVLREWTSYVADVLQMCFGSKKTTLLVESRYSI